MRYHHNISLPDYGNILIKNLANDIIPPNTTIMYVVLRNSMKSVSPIVKFQNTLSKNLQDVNISPVSAVSTIDGSIASISLNVNDGTGIANLMNDSKTVAINMPFAGKVMDVLNEGSSFVGGETKLFKIMHGVYRIVIFLPKYYLGLFKIGSPASISDSNGYAIPGFITSADNKIDPATETFRVTISPLDIKPDIMNIGDTVSVSLSRNRRDTFLINKTVLFERSGENFVMVIDNGYVRLKKVRILYKDIGNNVVLDGLKNGDIVILDKTLINVDQSVDANTILPIN